MKKLKQTTFRKFIKTDLTKDELYSWHVRDIHIYNAFGYDLPEDDEEVCSKVIFGNYLYRYSTSCQKALGYPEASLAITTQSAPLLFAFEM